MARNSERAMLLLNRWQALSTIVAKNRDGDRRGIDRQVGRCPKPRTLTSLSDVEYWRNTIVRELSMKIVELQNPLVEDVKLADLNEEVNQLVRDKFAFETRLVELGGRDFRKTAGTDFIQKHCVTTIDGKRYFGRAKELIQDTNLIPSNASNEHLRPNRHQLASRINGKYFGFNEHVSQSARAHTFARLFQIIYPDLLSQEQEAERKLARKLEEEASNGVLS